MDVVFSKDKGEKRKFQDFFKSLIGRIKGIKLSDTFYYFVILLAIGFGFYMLMLLDNGFTLAYGGDFTAQYIPMGYHVWDYYHEWIRTGHFTLFDPTLYLGANSIGSNSYYGLFSPFNIIIVILPRVAVPHSIAISSIIKLACAGLFFSLYMSSVFKVKDKVARICGIAYAFCGWGAFYLWYNNYQDILVFFPLVLWGIDKVIKEKKPWLLMTGVFLITICNYVLMVSYIICAFFYAVFRFFQSVKERTVKDNFIVIGLGALGFAGGLLASLFVFGPAFLATITSPKLEANSYFGQLKGYLKSGDLAKFFELLLSWGKAPDQHNRIFKNRVFYPILEFFFPATTCRSLPTLELNNWDFDDMAVSLWCYVPFIMFLIPALIQSTKDKKWSHLIAFALLVFSLFTPAMYFLTMGFTNGYARWTLFIVTSLLAYVGTYIDKIPNVAKWHMHIGFFFAIIGIVTAWILTWKIYVPNPTNGSQFIHRFVENDYDFTNIAYICELAYVLIVYLALLFTYDKKAFHILTTVFVSIEAIAVGNFVTIGHGYDQHYNNGYAENERFRKVLNAIKKDDKSFYRVYSSIGDDYSVNNGFINNYNTVGFFHSLYNFEINDFTLWTGLRNGTKSVSGDYRGKYQDIDNLLGVKYYFVSKEKSKYDLIEKNNPNGFIANVPFDFKENEKYEQLTDEYFVFSNDSLSQFGYAYSSIYDKMYEETARKNKDGSITKYAYTSGNTNIRHAIMMSQTAMLTEDDAQEIASTNADIVLEESRPLSYSLTDLFMNSNYVCKYYDISSAYKKEKIEAAKYYPFSKIPNIPNDFVSVDYSRTKPEKPKESKAMDYFCFFTAVNPEEPLFNEGTAVYIEAPFSGSEKYDFYMIDKENNIFMYDCHDDNTTDSTSNIRGFYIRRDVYKMAVVGKYYQSYFIDEYGNRVVKPSVEKRESYEARREALNAHPIENVISKPDLFTFETHYDKSMFVVSRVAYDQGWSIKGKNNDTGEVFNVKVYKGNGGFVSFVAPKGNISYTMTYKTPYLSVSLAISALTVTGFFLSIVGYYVYLDKKKPHYLDKVYREN
jgi:uncharacterized membrane protein YfhO